MLSSIHPFGERARGQGYRSTAVFFLLGSSIGGLVLGIAAAGGAALMSSLWGGSAPVALVVLIIAGMWELGGMQVPSISRQVDERWLDTYRGWVYGAGFGAQLGFGFVTYVTTALTYGFVMAVVLLGEPVVGVLAGVLFGFGRGLSIFITARAVTPDRLRERFRRLNGLRIRARIFSAAVVFAVSVIALGGLL